MMDKEYQNDQSTMFMKLTTLRLRTEKDLYSNGTAPKSPTFKDKYVIKSLRPFNEDKFALLVFYCSLSIVFSKILYANKQLFYNIFYITKSLFSFEGDVFFRIQTSLMSLWVIISDFSWIIVPVLIALVSSFITWRTVYVNIRLSGEKPFLAKIDSEPTKWYHWGYGLAIYVGILVFSIAFIGWNALVG